MKRKDGKKGEMSTDDEPDVTSSLLRADLQTIKIQKCPNGSLVENIFKSGTFNPLILGVNFEHGVLISAGKHRAPNTLKRCLPEACKHQRVWCPLEMLC